MFVINNNNKIVILYVSSDNPEPWHIFSCKGIQLPEKSSNVKKVFIGVYIYNYKKCLNDLLDSASILSFSSYTMLYRNPYFIFDNFKFKPLF